MSEEGTLWFRLWITVAVTIVLFVSAFLIHNAYKHHLISEEIIKGTHPILASCAHSSVEGAKNWIVCAQVIGATKK